MRLKLNPIDGSDRHELGVKFLDGCQLSGEGRAAARTDTLHASGLVDAGCCIGLLVVGHLGLKGRGDAEELAQLGKRWSS